MLEPPSLLAASLGDLAEDFHRLERIAHTNLVRLEAFQGKFLGSSSPLSNATRETIQAMVFRLIEDYTTIEQTLRGLQTKRQYDIHKTSDLSVVPSESDEPRDPFEGIPLHASCGIPPTLDDKRGGGTLLADSSVGMTYRQQLSLKKQTVDQLRSLQIMLAAALMGADWQSPSYDHTIASQAGRTTGAIKANTDDYKRDQHADAATYEHAFVRAYVDGGMPGSPRAFAVASGMAAVTTALACIHKKIDAHDIVLAGQESYFENRRLLREQFGPRLCLVNEMKIEEILTAVREKNPAAIFLDTLSNTPNMAMPDLKTLIPALSRAVKRTTYLVLDNSTRATSVQPLHAIPLFSKLQPIVIESLNKYHQYGFDRVTGGILWTTGWFANELFVARRGLGTNIPDTSVLALPEPHRDLMDRRLERIGRNTFLLATTLDAHLPSHKNSPISHVVYPGLPSYPGYAWTQKEWFQGGYFVLAFKPKYRRADIYEKFLSLVMKLAKQRKIDLVAGTSFGFDVTRIYLTAKRASQDGEPFVRIAPGTETRLEIEELKKLFIDAMRKF